MLNRNTPATTEMPIPVSKSRFSREARSLSSSPKSNRSPMLSPSPCLSSSSMDSMSAISVASTSKPLSSGSDTDSDSEANLATLAEIQDDVDEIIAEISQEIKDTLYAQEGSQKELDALIDETVEHITKEVPKLLAMIKNKKFSEEKDGALYVTHYGHKFSNAMYKACNHAHNFGYLTSDAVHYNYNYKTLKGKQLADITTLTSFAKKQRAFNLDGATVHVPYCDGPEALNKETLICIINDYLRLASAEKPVRVAAIIVLASNAVKMCRDVDIADERVKFVTYEDWMSQRQGMHANRVFADMFKNREMRIDITDGIKQDAVSYLKRNYARLIAQQPVEQARQQPKQQKAPLQIHLQDGMRVDIPLDASREQLGNVAYLLSQYRDLKAKPRTNYATTTCDVSVTPLTANTIFRKRSLTPPQISPVPSPTAVSVKKNADSPASHADTTATVVVRQGLR